MSAYWIVCFLYWFGAVLGFIFLLCTLAKGYVFNVWAWIYPDKRWTRSDTPLLYYLNVIGLFILLIFFVYNGLAWGIALIDVPLLNPVDKVVW